MDSLNVVGWGNVMEFLLFFFHCHYYYILVLFHILAFLSEDLVPFFIFLSFLLLPTYSVFSKFFCFGLFFMLETFLVIFVSVFRLKSETKR